MPSVCVITVIISCIYYIEINNRQFSIDLSAKQFLDHLK